MNGLTLRRPRPIDAEAFARMMGEPEVFGGVLQMPYADADLAPVGHDAAWPHGGTA